MWLYLLIKNIASANNEKKPNPIIKSQSEKITPEFIEKEWLKFCNGKKASYYPMLFGKGRIYNKLNRILKNKLADKLIGKRKKMTTMNLIRCDAHKEVVTTLLEKDYEK